MKRISMMIGFCAICMSAALCLAARPVEPKTIAVVVNTQNVVEGLTLKELVEIFRGEKQQWKPGQQITLVLRESGEPEKAVMLERIYQLSDRELKNLWIKKLLKHEIAGFPKTVKSDEAVKRFIAQVINAIGVIDASTADSRVKVVRIDGKLPGDIGYTLTTNN